MQEEVNQPTEATGGSDATQKPAGMKSAIVPMFVALALTAIMWFLPGIAGRNSPLNLLYHDFLFIAPWFWGLLLILLAVLTVRAAIRARRRLFTVISIVFMLPVIITGLACIYGAVSSQGQGDAKIHKGWRQIQARQYDKAADLFADSVRLMPDSPEAHYGLGYTYGAMKRYDDSVAELREAARLAPEWAQPHEMLGWVYRDLRQYSDSEAAFEESIKLEPDNVEAYLGLSGTYRRMKRFI